jgi:cyclophilin family peptidyl-prolyl cis-trans isomerase
MKHLIYLSAILCLLASCTPKPKDTLVDIHTPYGVIKVKLYDKTPKHRDNFLALAHSGFFDSTLFHRVIAGFMIQAGDPVSKHAQPGQMLGDGDTTYKIPAEFVEEYLNKRGALAAARESDDVNPNKESSACQFYIVHGKKFTDAGLDSAERKRERYTRSFILLDILKKKNDTIEMKKFQQLMQQRDIPNIYAMLDKYRSVVEPEYAKTKPFKLTPQQREVYKTVGGAPHLDGAYTVFGEVVSGMEIVDKIAALKTDTNDRPLLDVRLWMKVDR